jgi:hypothetical protein
MTNRAFIGAAAGAVAAMVAVACGSNGGGGGGSGAGGTTLPSSDCENQCGQVLSSCGYDTSQCGPLCAEGLSSGAIDCAQGAFCDPDQIQSCLQPSTTTSSSSGSTTTGTGTGTSTGTSTDTGPTCIADGQSGCDPSGPLCCSLENQSGSHVICNNGVCCAGSYQSCKTSTECCAGTTCVMDSQAGVLLCE